MRRIAIAGLMFASMACSPALAEDKPAPLTLAADVEPQEPLWQEPATFAYTSNNNGEDTWAVDAALKYRLYTDTRANTISLEGAVHRNTSSGDSQKEQYGLDLAYRLDDRPIGPFMMSETFKVGYSYKTTFPEDNTACVATPSLPDCSDQHAESIVGKLTFNPFYRSWASERYQVGSEVHAPRSGFVYEFLPSLTLFADNAYDAKVLSSGVKPTGLVTGSILSFSFKAAPALFNYDVVFGIKAQQIEAFSRADDRKDRFPQSTSYLKITADYEFGGGQFKKPKGFIPAIGITYLRGDDPLKGKVDDDSVEISFKLTYR